MSLHLCVVNLVYGVNVYEDIVELRPMYCDDGDRKC